MFVLRVFGLLTFLLLLCFPAGALAEGPSTGGSEYTAPKALSQVVVAGARAKLLPDGTAAAPADAPPAVQKAVLAANRLQNKPYRYGGGHARFEDSGYDCSGTVSYALHAGGLLKTPLNSSGFLSWGQRGRGQWITVFTNPGHAYAVIAGLRLDTSSYGVSSRSGRRYARSATERGPRWRPTRRPASGFVARHPAGF